MIRVQRDSWDVVILVGRGCFSHEIAIVRKGGCVSSDGAYFAPSFVSVLVVWSPLSPLYVFLNLKN